MKLYEKYRPPTIEEVVGQDDAKKALECTLRLGWGGKSYWISGPSGTGKTTLARILAGHGADEFYVEEFDSADSFTADDVRRIEQTMYMYGGGRGGRAYIINEAHGLWSGMIRRLLGLLERLPDHVVFIFTTTDSGQKNLFGGQEDAGPLLSRCIAIELTSEGMTTPFAKRCRQIAQAEGLDGQPLAQYKALARECKHNFRAMLQAVESGKMMS